MSINDCCIAGKNGLFFLPSLIAIWHNHESVLPCTAQFRTRNVCPSRKLSQIHSVQRKPVIELFLHLLKCLCYVNDKIRRKVPEVSIFRYFRDSLFLPGVKDRICILRRRVAAGALRVATRRHEWPALIRDRKSVV